MQRIAHMDEFGKIVIKEADMPTVRAHEVLIRVEYVGICGSNIHMFQHGPTVPPSDLDTVMVLGHECAGRVVEVGAEVKKIRAGDRVVIEPGVPCGKCEFCMEGRYNLCPDVDFIDVQPSYYGALRDYVAFPENRTFILPDNVSTLEGALVEPAAVGIHAAGIAQAGLGKRIVIIGGGCIGLMTLQACKCMGASEIVVIDQIRKRLDMARELGASYTINTAITDPVKGIRDYYGSRGADIVFEAAGTRQTAEMAFDMATRGSKIIMIGTITESVPVNFLKINREVTIQTVFRYANDFPKTLEAIASGNFKVKPMISNLYPFTETQRAFEESISRRKDIIKSVIKVSDEL